jgi:hypothetical protein
LKWFLSSGRLPPQKTFRCARCSIVEPYSRRTIDAWKDGKAKLFCAACHAKWLETRPARLRSRYAGNSGCLGTLVVVTLLPATILTGAVCYAVLAS